MVGLMAWYSVKTGPPPGYISFICRFSSLKSAYTSVLPFRYTTMRSGSHEAVAHQLPRAFFCAGCPPFVQVVWKALEVPLRCHSRLQLVWY